MALEQNQIVFNRFKQTINKKNKTKSKKSCKNESKILYYLSHLCLWFSFFQVVLLCILVCFSMVWIFVEQGWCEVPSDKFCQRGLCVCKHKGRTTRDDSEDCGLTWFTIWLHLGKMLLAVRCTGRAACWAAFLDRLKVLNTLQSLAREALAGFMAQLSQHSRPILQSMSNKGP